MDAMPGHHHTAVGGLDLAARLHARGLRVTPQRERVLAAVGALGHATPEQIFDAVPEVDLATVYRTLELLEDIGMVRHTHLGHGAPAYRPAEDDHIHVVCHECGSVVDAPAELTDDLERRLRDERGFAIDRAHFTVFGRCATCQAASPAAEQNRTTDG
jgi:Fur family transcriptional regulator, ferric uptake regulator